MKKQDAQSGSYTPPIEGEPVYNLMEAVELIGRTTGLLYAPKNRERLEEFGAKTGGRDWRIPHSALVRMGWLQDDGTQTHVRTSNPVSLKADIRRELQYLEAENTRLKAENDELRLRNEQASVRLTDKDSEILRLTKIIGTLLEKQ